ncbi:hypothetical protein HU200_060998 [Digitaria exilis]|uniref:Uncharacterized protein n=1 Tax=Digitaria exilis TaxID=1010633 RepID=A0A835A839_9POAL|nr:hypothetical protein HU200_060998 [Digitaria exilis]
MQNLTATSVHHRCAAAPTSIKAPRASLRIAPNSILTGAIGGTHRHPPTQGPAAGNGFNFLPSAAAGHHLFDGDGILPNNGAAETYACQLTETGRLHGHYGMARLLDPSRGRGTGVVVHAGRLVFFDDRLVAMMSGDDLRRHQVRVADDFYYGQLGCAATIAHPSLDPASGDLFPFRRASHPTMIHHDFAVAENHHQVVVFNLPVMFRGGSPVVLDDDRAKKTSRFAVLLPNYAASEVVWALAVPDNSFFFFFHLWMTRADDSTFTDDSDRLQSVLPNCTANSPYYILCCHSLN